MAKIKSEFDKAQAKKTRTTILLVSLVWITIAAILVGSYSYGEMRHEQGIRYGIQQTKTILTK